MEGSIKLNEVEGNDKYHVEISNRLDDLDTGVEINNVSEPPTKRLEGILKFRPKRV
jgi:hypothetical protein